MTSVVSKPLHVPIDEEWARSLVGLQLQVPSSWWSGCSGNDLNVGKIADVDFTQHGRKYFLLKLDNKQGVFYNMRYNAVFVFADANQCGVLHFCLPGGEKVVVVDSSGGDNTPFLFLLFHFLADNICPERADLCQVSGL